jgi:hypothetical protein
MKVLQPFRSCSRGDEPTAEVIWQFTGSVEQMLGWLGEQDWDVRCGVTGRTQFHTGQTPSLMPKIRVS